MTAPGTARPARGRAARHRPRPGPGADALAWTRTAISFAAVGGVVLKKEVIPGLILLCLAPAIWAVGRRAYRRPDRLKIVTATIVAVA